MIKKEIMLMILLKNRKNLYSRIIAFCKKHVYVEIVKDDEFKGNVLKKEWVIESSMFEFDWLVI